MKKIIILILALIMVLTLAACNGGNKEQNNNDPLKQDDNGSQQTQGGTENSDDVASNLDFDAIMTGNGNTDTVLGQLDAADRQAVIDAANENGMEASFGADGSFTLKDPNGAEIVQKADGTWVFKSDDGGEGQFGGNWPDNKFTRLVPKPDFTLLAVYGDDDSFNVNFENTTLEQIRAYVEKVKTKGFTIDPVLVDQLFQGVMVFSYSASNADGYSVQIVAASGESCITITAP